MPPVTSSPHRFLTGRRRQKSPAKDAKPSRLRRQLPPEQDAPPQRTSWGPSESQFAPTPRFATGRPSKAASQLRSPAPAFQVLKPAPEAVEEAKDGEDEDDEMLDNEQMEALPTTESTQRYGDEQAWTKELPHSPKRRRLDQFQTAVQSPARPVFKHPTIPASVPNAGPYRYSRASSGASTVNDETSNIRRPAFLRSSLAPSEQHEPLPEAFSPHRRGEKFVPGGMAATLQQWIVETGQSAAHSRKGRGYLKGDDYVIRAKVECASGRGPIMAEGRQSDGTLTRLLLVVDAKKGVVDVAAGRIVGVRAPCWEVAIDECRWTVCVDWQILRE